MSSKTNGFAQGTVLKIAYSMLGVTSCVVLARCGLNLIRPKRLTASDYLVFLAFACYTTISALYTSLSTYMQRLYDVVNGNLPPDPEMVQDNGKMTKIIFAAPCLFWMKLWPIRFSLLLLYRRLLAGLPRGYNIIWWGIAGICLVTHIGNCVLYFRSCGTIPGFWTGGCSGNTAKHAQLASLYHSFTADTSTKIMIMALPIGLTWNLQMPRSKQTAILLLFTTGFICIIFACLRVSQVAINAAKPEADGQPLDPTWLAIWGMVECSIAFIIGCCPAFAVLVNAFRTKAIYDSQGYRKPTGTGTGQGRDIKVQLRTISSVGARHSHHLVLNTTDSIWADAHSSQEQLRATHDGILVSTTVTQKQGGTRALENR